MAGGLPPASVITRLRPRIPLGDRAHRTPSALHDGVAERPGERGAARRDVRRGERAELRVAQSAWRMTGRLAAPASSSRRTGVV
jgi:hypothetical protein